MSKTYGVVPAKVVSEPDEMGQVRVQLKFMGDNSETYPAPVAAFMSGAERGAWFMPEIGDDVLVAFEQGNVEKPYILGFLWNGEDRAPSTDRRERLLRSVNGHQITMYDPEISAGDTGYIRIEDAHGNMVELSNAAITIRSVGTIEIQAPNVIINGRPVAIAPRPI
jgi:uncharacterized protein involved in type VI secretion and phage assembly